MPDDLADHFDRARGSRRPVVRMPKSWDEVLEACRGNASVLLAMVDRCWVTAEQAKPYMPSPQRTPFRPGRKRTRLPLRFRAPADRDAV